VKNHTDHIFFETDADCFCAGTRLLTEYGDIAVEDVRVGDLLVTIREGGPPVGRVVWTGRRQIDISRHPRPETIRPVRINAGAFAPHIPMRNLRLSPGHAIYMDGALFEAIALVNGTSIVQEQDAQIVTYHHVELETHDVLLAEGLPAESFSGDRAMFEGRGQLVLHPDFSQSGPRCLPLITKGPLLEEMRRVLKFRASRRKREEIQL
jgi:hypothetical protein